MVIGAVLVLVGLIGFFNAPIFGLFGVNAAQNILHIVGGGLMLWLAGKMANTVLGYVSAVVAVLGFIPGASDLLASIFAINTAITVLHLLIAIVSLGVAYAVKE